MRDSIFQKCCLNVSTISTQHHCLTWVWCTVFVYLSSRSACWNECEHRASHLHKETAGHKLHLQNPHCVVAKPRSQSARTSQPVTNTGTWNRTFLATRCGWATPLLPGLPRRVANIFNRGDKQQPSFNIYIFNVPCLQSIIHEMCIFLALSCWKIAFRFKSTNKVSVFIELASSKIFIVKSQVSTRICSYTCKSANKHLDAMTAPSAVSFLQPILQMSKKVIAGAIAIALLTVFTRCGCTTIPHVQSKASSDFALSHSLPT